MDLATALDLGDREHVAFVGAGGKKTAMASLVGTAAERELRVGYTTTTQMPPPADLPLVVAQEAELEQTVASATSPVAFARERVDDPDRAAAKVRGHDPNVLDALFEGEAFDWLLVKADGARRREFKAPGAHEPVIPTTSTHVVPVASVRAVGQPLDETIVHRPERVAVITGLDPGATITPSAIGTVIASEQGGCKNVPDSTTITPLVNKADTDAQRETAREILAIALDRSDRLSSGIVTSFETDYLERISQ